MLYILFVTLEVYDALIYLLTSLFRSKLTMKLPISILLFGFSLICLTFYIYEYHTYLCKSNYDYPFQDPTLPIDVRLNNLMSLLTLEEKVIIIHIHYNSIF